MTITIQDIIDAGLVLTAPASGDYLLLKDISEEADSREWKAIKFSDLVNLAAQSALQALVAGQAAGDLFYASSATALARLAKPAVDSVLKNTSAGTLSWKPLTEFATSLSSCRLRRETNQAIANNTYDTIKFTSEDWDDDNFHSDSVNTDRITIPEDGKYMFGASVYFPSRANGMRRMWVGLGSGSSFLCGASDIFDAGTGTCMLSCSGLYEFTAGNYIRVIVWQNSGSSLNVEVQDAMPNFWIMKIGD